jgi:hypothetical protein
VIYHSSRAEIAIIPGRATRFAWLFHPLHRATLVLFGPACPFTWPYCLSNIDCLPDTPVVRVSWWC